MKTCGYLFNVLLIYDFDPIGNRNSVLATLRLSLLACSNFLRFPGSDVIALVLQNSEDYKSSYKIHKRQHI